MNTAVIMRNSKARTFLYVLLACAMMFTVFLLSSTHTKLKETQESHEKCQQQRDSLSAQLQVVYEHKSRLEKTLQTETLERKKADEALQLSRDEWERDKKGVQSKANQLERKLEEMDKSHQEEFGNLKSSYNSLQQEKEKLEADLARHVVLLQQERDAHLSLNREIAELRDLKLKGDVALDTEVKKLRSQLETCHSEQNLLRATVQQLKSIQGPGIAPQIPDMQKLQDHAASNVQRAQVVGSAEVGAVLPKSEAKEAGGAQKYGEQNQQFGAESPPRKKDAKAGDGVNSGILGALPVAKRPEVNEQVVAPAVAKSSSTTTTTSTMRPAQALGDGAVIPQGAAPPLKDNLHVQFKSPQNPIQLEVAKQPAEMPAEQPGQQIAQPAVPQLPKPALPSVEAALQKSVAPKAPKALGVGQADKDLSDQEQPPLQAPENENGDGQDEAIAAPKKQEAAAGNADGNKEMQVRPPVAKAAHGEAGDHQVAAGGDSVPVLGAAPDVEVPPKPVNGEAAQVKKGNAPARRHEENLLWGGHRNGAAWQGGRQAEEENQEYVNPAKDDDAAEDQEDDGPFGAAGDAAQGKHFPDAADFDDQAAEGDVQQPNHGREEGMMVNPK